MNPISVSTALPFLPVQSFN